MVVGFALPHFAPGIGIECIDRGCGAVHDAGRGAYRRTDTEGQRTPPAALNVHRMQPDFASSE
jgi:hypothetical protein